MHAADSRRPEGYDNGTVYGSLEIILQGNRKHRYRYIHNHG